MPHKPWILVLNWAQLITIKSLNMKNNTEKDQKKSVLWKNKSANTNQAKHKDGKVTMMLQGHIFTCQMQY